MNRLFPILITALVGLSLLTGCSLIGYSIGRGLDKKDTTFSIKNSSALEHYVGKKITVIDNDRYAHNATLDSLTRTGDSTTRRLYMTEALNRFGERDNHPIEFAEDKVIDIMATKSRGSSRYVLGGIGLAIDVAAIAFAIAFGNAWSGWGSGLNFGK